MSNSNLTRILFIPAELIVDDQMSERTLARCQKALELWKTNDYDFLVVTGGRFLKPSTQTMPAGVIMGHWFYQQGVDPAHLVVERDSLDTFENITHSMTALRAFGLGDPQKWDVTVITQWQHAWRFRLSFWNMYGVAATYVEPDYQLNWIEWCKEWIFVLVHFIDPFGRGAIAEYNRAQRRLAANGE